MDALETQIDDDCIMTFDGHVLERFGYQSADRFHVRLLGVAVAGPDKRGYRTVHLKRSRGGGSEFQLDAAAFERFGQVLDALEGAGVPVAR